MQIVLPIAVIPGFLKLKPMIKGEIRGQLMLTMRAFLRKAFNRTLRFSRTILPAPLTNRRKVIALFRELGQ
ncbi:hypothetical protein B4V02_20250 [Paenibacillus kribbensis]|uniref:Uncharacterized protein n=1 Tax=Paenibacillus kribbensis TaxID=172713 RepID=A0A222WT28_9BACL|nr:hypothetical protein [Paenibacillus kribbensis]ASR48863.1 hypothetical protein B4V02_20250 [Paenibacillus kribbensis]